MTRNDWLKDVLDGIDLAVAVADRLVPPVTEVTPVNERILRLRIKHTLGVVSLVSVYCTPLPRLASMP